MCEYKCKILTIRVNRRPYMRLMDVEIVSLDWQMFGAEPMNSTVPQYLYECTSQKDSHHVEMIAVITLITVY